MADDAIPSTAIDAPPDSATRLLILIGGPVAALPLVAITSVLPQIGQALAHGPGDALLVKQLVGGVGLAMMIGAALAGLLIERIGLRRVLTGAALIYAVAGTAGLWLSNLPGLLASRLLLGIAAATVQVACILVVNMRLAGAARARWMGLHISSAMAATILIHPVAGGLGTLGWRWPFVLYAAGLILIPAARAQPAFVRRPRAPAAAPVPAAPRGWFPFRFILLALAVGSIVYMPSIQIPFLPRERALSSPASASPSPPPRRRCRCSWRGC